MLIFGEGQTPLGVYVLIELLRIDEAIAWMYFRKVDSSQ
jgi:hypothetical protein